MFAVLGWLAVGLYVCAQAYIALVVQFRRRWFYALNVAGAVLLALASAAILSWQAVAVNLFWAVVSVLGIRSGAWPERLRVPSRVVFWPILAVIVAGLVGVVRGTPDAGFDLLGWGGTLLYCGIYLLFAAGDMGRRRYLLLNVAASVLLMPVYYLDGNLPSLTLNVFWAGISLAGVFAIAVRGRPPESGAVPGEPPLRQAQAGHTTASTPAAGNQDPAPRTEQTPRDGRLD